MRFLSAGLGSVAAALSLLLAPAPARATSVIAPSFAELVNEADLIARVRVVDVRCAWAESPQGRVIKTHVTFAVEKPLKGASATELTLSFLGGELDGQGMRVSGMPQFTVGQSDVVFVTRNRAQICPLVAMMHGRYHVQTDAASGRDYITRNDGVPLVSEHDVQLPQVGNPLELRLKPASAALSASAFEQLITRQLSGHVTQP